MHLRLLLAGTTLASALWSSVAGQPVVRAVGEFQFAYTMHGHGDYTATLVDPRVGVCIDASIVTDEAQPPDAVQNAMNYTDTEATMYQGAFCSGERVAIGAQTENHTFYFRSVRFGAPLEPSAIRSAARTAGSACPWEHTADGPCGSAALTLPGADPSSTASPFREEAAVLATKESGSGKGTRER
ncbi:hypothetical protein [Streptomyces sp. AP-93]|uniref:hypothetical protein n=1 Tax=Streptomyces sp. AP-93 TaxID=2929048 RepID=UPI001FB01781|nr:hypothetical protein [Streptomyces sp. AP-93]MCJ0874967.1 hypothetical protein [Streptomyces sp. AP-93]